MGQTGPDRAGTVGALVLVVLGLLFVALGLFGVVRWLGGGATSGVFFAVGIPALLAAGLVLRRPSPTTHSLGAVVGGLCGLFPMAVGATYPDLWPYFAIGAAFWLAAVLLIVAALRPWRARKATISK
jgi:hypothetical protein